MIGDMSITWTFTVEQRVRDIPGDEKWIRTLGIEVDEHTARDMYRKAIAEGLPEHLRAPRVTRVVRTIMDEPRCRRCGQPDSAHGDRPEDGPTYCGWTRAMVQEHR